MRNATQPAQLKHIFSPLLRSVVFLIAMGGFVATTNAMVLPSVSGESSGSERNSSRLPTRGMLSPATTPSAKRLPSGANDLPRIPSYRPEVDANTVALYRFDYSNDDGVPEETNRFTGTLNGNATIMRVGWYGGALQTDGNNSYMRTGTLGNLNAGTIEAYVDFASACFLPDGTPTVSKDFAIVSAVNESTGQTMLYLGAHVGLMFGIYINGAWYWADSGINPCRYLNGPNPPAGSMWPYEKWRFHHVAATWGPRGMEIWVDGVLHGVGTTDPTAGIQPYRYMCNPQMQLASAIYPLCQIPVMAPPYPPGDYTGGLGSYSSFRVGCDSTGICFKGKIDELRISNIQRTFSPIYDPPTFPNPTPLPNPTPTAIGALPDFVVTDIQAPLVSSGVMTKTILVNVFNQGTGNFNYPAQSAPLSILGKGAGTQRRNSRADLMNYSGTTNYFFYVDVYVDRSKPLNLLEPGNCPAKGGGTSWSWVYNLAIGQTVTAPVDCWLAPGMHTFYVQVDMCDDPGGNICSPVFGYILERNENNNVNPALLPIRSRDPFTFIPLILYGR
ncbi:hypothetical protein ANRL3_01763 [Anaerolineae bacterium]|nr:hypothetical protein ANRL3_01763 [Anaerolineae bacterium]